MKQSKSSIDWNLRFSTQAEWTRPLRNFLSGQLGINHDSKVLEIGSGTGTILRECADFSHCTPIGIDSDFSRLIINKDIQPEQIISYANAYNLPFSLNSFDFVISHYLLLWLNEPIAALKQVFNVLKPNGTAIAYAEPDYMGRIESPEEFIKLGKLQTKALRNQGANIEMGRKLPEIFSRAGFIDIQFGISGFQKPLKGLDSFWNSEWSILENDLDNFRKKLNWDQYRLMDIASRRQGTRVSWVPTFYAYGRKPEF